MIFFKKKEKQKDTFEETFITFVPDQIVWIPKDKIREFWGWMDMMQRLSKPSEVVYDYWAFMDSVGVDLNLEFHLHPDDHMRGGKQIKRVNDYVYHFYDMTLLPHGDQLHPYMYTWKKDKEEKKMMEKVK